jgi:hypothetical protein
MKKLTFLIRALLFSSTTMAQTMFSVQDTDVNINEFKAHLKFLSDNKLQGRASGTLGGDIAAMYIASQFERCGLKPISAEQGYFQQYP